MVQELSWLNIGTDIIVDFAILLSRWMPKPSKRTKKSSRRKELLCKLKEKLKKNKLPIKLQLEKERKMPKKVKRNDWIIKLQYIV